MLEPGSLSSVEEAGLRVRDLTMLEVFNSRERGVGDWEEGVWGRVGVGMEGGRRLVLEETVRGGGSLLGVMVLGVREVAEGEVGEGL